MKNVFDKGVNRVKEAALSTYDSTLTLIDDAASIISTNIGALTLKSQLLSKYSGEEQYDEKHYFLIPNPLSECNYSAFSLRWLPDDTPPINELPKRRVIHLPSEQSEAQLKKIIVSNAKAHALEESTGAKSVIGEGLINVANEIDRLEDKVTNGAILVGGLVALFNPVVGVGIAMQALIPGIGASLSKYGLNNVGEKLNQSAVNKCIEEAEKEVLEQFKDSKTIKYVNPALVLVEKCFKDESFGALDWIDIQERLISDNQEKIKFYEAGINAVCSTFRDKLTEQKSFFSFSKEKSVLPSNLTQWMSIHIKN